MGKQNIKTAIHISFAEFMRWIRSSRLIILGVMLVFVHIQIITTLQNTALMMEMPVSYLEAFVALGNSGVIVLIVPALWLVLMGDFPQKSGIDLFYQIRCSKRTWICGQVLFVVEAAVFLVAFLLIFSIFMLWGYGEWNLEFSEAVRFYASTFPERRGDYILTLLPENLYQQMNLGTAIVHTIFLMLLYFLLLAFVLLVAALCNQKMVGFLVDAVLILLGTVTTAMETKWMWLFPMAHSITGVHYEKYLSAEIFPMKLSYVYMIFGSMGLIVCCMVVARKYQAGR